MTPGLSIFLNLLRILGAGEVFVGHLCDFGKDCGFIGRLPWLGSDGVVLFFVLSGYVIAYAAAERERTLRNYFIHRTARIYSVALPAIFLSIAIAWAGLHWFPAQYGGENDTYRLIKLPLYLPIWLSFASEFWGLNETVVGNNPFWSLCFEVWFYVFFAVAWQLRGWSRFAALAGLALLVGPKICCFLILWLLGVGAYHWPVRLSLSPVGGRILLVTSIAAYLMVKVIWLDRLATEGLDAALYGWPKQHLQMVWQFPGYLLLAICFAGALLGARYDGCGFLNRVSGFARWGASFTFSIYLMHTPLLRFSAAAMGPWVETMLLPSVATLCIIGCFGVVTEHRLRAWRYGVTAVTDRIIRAVGRRERT